MIKNNGVRKHSLLISFARASGGSVVIMVAIMLTLIIGIVMVTVDLSRVQSGSTNNQSATDAAALGAAEYLTRYRIINQTNGSPEDIEDQAKKILLQNLANDQSDATIAKTEAGTDDFSVTVEPESVTVNACLIIRTGFASSLGQGETQKVCSVSASSVPGFGNVEIVFALDVSDSMTDNVGGVQKLEALKGAVDSLLTNYTTNFSNSNVYWGVVPYTGIVDLGANSVNIVADDRATASNYSELTKPGPSNFYGWNLSGYDSYYDVKEDFISYGIGSVFDSTYYKRINNSSAIDSLTRIPLTTRIDGTTSFIDGSSPAVNKFQAYWHQPYDFFFQFLDTYSDNSKQCGFCTSGVVRSEFVDINRPDNCIPPTNPCCGGGCGGTTGGGNTGGIGE